MTIYDFNQPVDRSRNFSVKYDEAELKFGTTDLMPMWIADMDLPTAPVVVDSIIERARQGIFGYTARPNSYFEAVRQWQKERNGWDTKTEFYSFCPGVVSALATIIREFSKPGDEILIQTPVYPEFSSTILGWGRKVLENPLLEDDGGQYHMNYKDLEGKLARRPAMMIFCNPHNPGGRVWTPEEMTQMGELCLKYGVLMVSDEIHSDLMLFGHRHTPLAKVAPEIAANTITCTSATKTFNLAGLQASTIIHPNFETKKRFDALWCHLDLRRNNCFSLVAVEAAFRHGGEWLEQLLHHIEGNMVYLDGFLKENLTKVKMALPESTYLAWINFNGLGMSPDDLCRFMVKEAKLGLNDGRDFGSQCGGYLRLNVACPRPYLEKALKQLKDAVDQL